jgi:hypothetical protein
MLKSIGVILTVILVFSLINGMITHSDAASMPFGAFLMDVFFLIWVIFYFVIALFKGFKKGMKFKEVVKANYFWMGSFVVLTAYLINDIIHYLLK